MSFALRSTGDLSANARDLFQYAMAEADASLDRRSNLLAAGPAGFLSDSAKQGVRESAMYAAALLFRDQVGDRDCAARVIRAVLEKQIHAPGAIYHGTFYRGVDEPPVSAGAVVWKNYDPNWRQFIGCCWSIILLCFREKISNEIATLLIESMTKAIDGERAAGRLTPAYTNIAIMHAFVAGVAGELAGRDDLKQEADRYMEACNDLFRATDTFDEYNSPTYYGVDLYGLSLWRALGRTPRMRELGAAMERDLWLDMAQTFQAGLRNQCGPFDRTYGMDMRKYVGLSGLHLRLQMSEAVAPFPPLSKEMGHRHDLAAAMIYPIVPTLVPELALRSFSQFAGERLVTRTLRDGRVVTSWLSERVMIGGQANPLAPRHLSPQYRPATIHWRLPDGDIGWIALVEARDVNATASANRLVVRASGGGVFQAYVGSAGVEVTRGKWTLPGLELQITTDAKHFASGRSGAEITLEYVGATEVVIETRS